MLGLVLGMSTLSSPAMAIVNVLPSSGHADGLSAKLSAALTWRTGNTELLQFDGGGQVGYATGKHSFILQSKVTYAQKGSEAAFIAKSFEHLRYRYHVLEWLTLESLLQIQFDELKSLTFRGLAGAGAAINWQPLEVFKVVWGTTYILEREVEGQDTTRVESLNHRLSTYLQVGWDITETIVWRSTGFYQPRLDDLEDVRILGQNKLTVKASELFGVSISFDAAYDSEPFSPELANLDTTLKTSLIFTF